jgi:hypothetical protein
MDKTGSYEENYDTFHEFLEDFENSIYFTDKAEEYVEGIINDPRKLMEYFGVDDITHFRVDMPSAVNEAIDIYGYCKWLSPTEYCKETKNGQYYWKI